MVTHYTQVADKEERFEKVVEYYYHEDNTNDRRYEYRFNYYIGEIVIMFIVWIFFPLFFIFKKDCMFKGKRKVFWRKIK